MSEDQAKDMINGIVTDALEKKGISCDTDGSTVWFDVGRKSFYVSVGECLNND